MRNAVLERLRGGGLALCLNIKQARTVDIVLAARTCGYDAINLDLEHSSISEENAAQICVAALGVGVAPLVRVPNHDAHYATRVLDAGALGIVFPHVNTAQEARHVVQGCKFAPFGERSVAAGWPHFGYAAYPAEVTRRVFNEQTLVATMIETREAVANADAIAAVDGVDVLHVGGNDLCEAFGVPGQFRHPAIREALETLSAACRIHGKYLGIGGMSSDPELTVELISIGARFITAGNEWGFMMAAASQRAKLLRAIEVR